MTRILVTGARGKVGAATVAALVDAGHDVSATDLGRPRFEAGGIPLPAGGLDRRRRRIRLTGALT
jgi:nucleoside-diphosphate-sugar epimerase